MTNMNKLFFIGAFAFLPAALAAATLNIDMEYKLSGYMYANLDYDTSTSTDSIAFYANRLRLTVGGRFHPGIEIQSKLQSLSVAGSTAPILLPGLPWWSALPYPSITGVPFAENLFVRMKNIFEQPADLTLGRQPFDFGGGIFSDNSAGLTGIKLKIDYPNKLQSEFFTAKLMEGFAPRSDFDFHGFETSYTLHRDTFTFFYLSEVDRSGSLYIQGDSQELTELINRNFYQLRLNRKDEFGLYKAAVTKLNGRVNKTDGASIPIDAFAWSLSGTLKTEDPRIGDVSAGLLVSMFSGDDDATSAADSDEAFSAGSFRRFDGLDPLGYGKLFGANHNTSAIELHPGYSGINTLGLIFEFSPFYAWSFGLNYYLFSAARHPLNPTQEASGLEKILGSRYSLGVEMNLYLRFIHSKYIDAFLGYFRYTPPADIFWTHRKPLTKYQLDITARF